MACYLYSWSMVFVQRRLTYVVPCNIYKLPMLPAKGALALKSIKLNFEIETHFTGRYFKIVRHCAYAFCFFI